MLRQEARSILAFTIQASSDVVVNTLNIPYLSTTGQQRQRQPQLYVAQLYLILPRLPLDWTMPYSYFFTRQIRFKAIVIYKTFRNVVISSLHHSKSISLDMQLRVLNGSFHLSQDGYFILSPQHRALKNHSSHILMSNNTELKSRKGTDILSYCINLIIWVLR